MENVEFNSPFLPKKEEVQFGWKVVKWIEVKLRLTL